MVSIERMTLSRCSKTAAALPIRSMPSGSCLRFIPTEKFSSPAEVSNTARISALLEISITCCSSSSIKFNDIRLNGGSLSVSLATAPKCSTNNDSLMSLAY